MSIVEFVSHLRNLDVRLSAEGQRLRLNAPKGVLTDSLRAQIAERKQELLQFLSDYEQSAAFIPPPIVQRTSSDPPPLSFAQERLWFLEQLEPGSAVYNICRASRLTGQLNIAALEASLTEIVRRHEILRSQIRVIDGRPRQPTTSAPEFKLHFTDLRSPTGTELEEEIRRQIRSEGERQLDFSAGLCLRAVLLQISHDEHILVLTTHHIVSDAWSMGILTQELWTLYDAYASGKPSPMQDLAVQYADYAVWQREWLQGEALEAQLSYWRKQLESLPVLSLPINHPRPAKQSFRGARQPLSLPESLTKAVNELSGREGVTQFMTLLAVFQVLLYRYSGQEDVVVGLPIANRNRTETEGLIGFFVNTLVLRADLSEKPTFKELLQRVRNVCLQAYAHQDLPFEKLVEELRPERDLSRNPLFQVMLVLQNTPRPLPQSAALSIEPVDVRPATSLFDLSLYLRERNGKLIGFFEYNTDLFESSTIRRMVGHFKTLLEGIVANPDQPITNLPILTDSELHQLLVEWNDTAAEYPKDSCIHELFEGQAERTPDAVAVQFEGKQLTYRELNSRANQSAHYLRGLGVGPEKLVGICVDRSLEMVVGLLGILKAGGAYVPLDPAYPRERLEFMLSDSQCSFLVTQQSTIEDRRWRMEDGGSPSSILGSQMKVVCLDNDWETIALESEQNTGSEVKPDNLAYVIYTSGSSGQPKGVAIEHRNTTALLHWARGVFTPEELSGVLASTSICFDLSIFELFVPLSRGGKVILVENVLQLPSGSGRNQVTLINTVPSAMAELLRISGLPESLRTVNLAGEPLRSDLVEQIYGWRNVNKVYDLYGPSETTTYSTFTLRASKQRATIGRPIANSRIYILDGSLQPVPVCVAGEIFIGGAGVARGYLNRSELTDEMFIADPFRGSRGGQLYRTGDRGRYLPDGNIEFIGRMDNQVKIRGYRIELEEIEAALNQHPAIKEAVVVTRDRDSSGEKDLIGYFVPEKSSPVAISGLRNFLREKLPDYMVPSLFVELEVLPLSPNGKIDRITLRSPDDTRPELKETYVEPRTRVEELLIQMWEEVLKIEAVGIHDNFFELGGHSLLAIQIISRVRKALDKAVPLSALFDTPTVAGLAATIEKTISGRSHDLPPIGRAPRDEPLPLSMNQEHLWRLDRLMPGTHFFNMPYVYRFTGNLNFSALEHALQEIIRRHEALRTNFAEMDGRPVQVINEVPDFQLPYLDLRGKSTDEVSQRAASVILEEREGPFNLESGPLLRTKLIRLTDTDCLLLLTIHHIISDHWSMQIFRRELAALYEAFAQGRPSPLPEPTTQFADFAIWERRLLQMSLLDNQLSYWKKQLVAPLPESFDVNKLTKTLICEMSHETVEIDQTLYAAIRDLVEREQCTPYTVLLGALIVALCAHTGNQDVLIATLAANRSEAESECLIGHLMNTLLLRFQVSMLNTTKQLLRQVRAQIIEAFTHQQYPFEELAQVLESDAGIARQSICQVLLIYQYRYPEVTRCSGLTFAPFDLQFSKPEESIGLSSFDLILRVIATSTELTGTVNYRTLSGVQAHRIVQVFSKTLRLMVSDPNEILSAAIMQV